MGAFLLFVFGSILELVIWAIILNAVLSWLVVFEVVSLRNRVARQFAELLDGVSRPVLAPFRRIIPVLGTVDVSPIVAIIVLEGVRLYLLPLMFGWMG